MPRIPRDNGNMTTFQMKVFTAIKYFLLPVICIAVFYFIILHPSVVTKGLSPKVTGLEFINLTANWIPNGPGGGYSHTNTAHPFQWMCGPYGWVLEKVCTYDECSFGHPSMIAWVPFWKFYLHLG